MTELEKAKAEMQIMKHRSALCEYEYKIMESMENIERIKEQAEKQKEMIREIELQLQGE